MITCVQWDIDSETNKAKTSVCGWPSRPVPITDFFRVAQQVTLLYS